MGKLLALCFCRRHSVRSALLLYLRPSTLVEVEVAAPPGRGWLGLVL